MLGTGKNSQHSARCILLSFNGSSPIFNFLVLYALSYCLITCVRVSGTLPTIARTDAESEPGLLTSSANQSMRSLASQTGIRGRFATSDVAVHDE